MSTTEIQVRPTGWESSPESQKFTISPLGHVMPKIYVLVAEVFPLSGDSPSTDDIVKNLESGLALALAQFPVLCGTLEMDETNGLMWALKKRDAAATLHVKYMIKDGEFPSYKELEAKDFPAALVNGSQILPPSVTTLQLHSPLGDNNSDGIPLVTFQINFILGGLVLGMAVHHALSDGPGCDGFLSTWAENSKAIGLGKPTVDSGHTYDIGNSPLNIGKPSAARVAEVKDSYPMLKDAGGPMPAPPPGFQMPPLSQQMWHFPKSKLALLKAKATSPGNDGNWVSTYDSVMALLWSRIANAKVDLLKPDLETATTALVHAVDSRKLWDPPLPERFLGTAAVPGHVPAVTLKDVVAPPDPANPDAVLRKLAAGVRASIRKLSEPRYLTGMQEWIAGHQDQRYLEVKVNSFLGMDLGASSWQGMSAYEKHDFGFGLPRALRWPSPPFEGFVFLYPSRAAFKDASADEGIEVCVCLEDSSQQRLLKDSLLLEFASPRG